VPESTSHMSHAIPHNPHPHPPPTGRFMLNPSAGSPPRALLSTEVTAAPYLSGSHRYWEPPGGTPAAGAGPGRKSRGCCSGIACPPLGRTPDGGCCWRLLLAVRSAGTLRAGCGASETGEEATCCLTEVEDTYWC
jgi:hypothetical protein